MNNIDPVTDIGPHAIKTLESVECFSQDFIKKLVKCYDGSNYTVSPIGVNVLLSFFVNNVFDKTTVGELHKVLCWNAPSFLMSARTDYNIFFNESNRFWMYGNHILVPNAKEYDSYFQQLNRHPVNRLISKFNHKFELCCTLNAVHDAEYTMKVLRPYVLQDKIDKHHILTNVSNVEYQLKCPFYKKNTRPMPFRTPENDTVLVDMMYQFKDMFVYVSEKFTYIRLECKDNRLFILITLSNNEKITMQQLRKSGESFQLNKIVKRLKSRKVQLFLPKCKILSAVDIRPVLNDMGLRKIFSRERRPVSERRTHFCDTSSCDYNDGCDDDDDDGDDDDDDHDDLNVDFVKISKFIQIIHMSFDDTDCDCDGVDIENRKHGNDFRRQSLSDMRVCCIDNAVNGFGAGFEKNTQSVATRSISSDRHQLSILSIHVNRPFFFHVYSEFHTDRRTTLYFGHVCDPKKR